MAYGAIPGDGTTGAAEAPQQRCKVAVAILLCLLTISVVPLANKAVLKRGANGAPLAMTACQLLGAALLFGLYYVLHSAATGSLARPTRAELRIFARLMRRSPSTGPRWRPARQQRSRRRAMQLDSCTARLRLYGRRG